VRLYRDVFRHVASLRINLDLLRVLRPDEDPLIASEVQAFQTQKRVLDALGTWIGKSAIGLRHLHETYARAVPKFEMLAEESLQQSREIAAFATRLDEAFNNKVKLPPLMPFSRTTTCNNQNNNIINNNSSTVAQFQQQQTPESATSTTTCTDLSAPAAASALFEEKKLDASGSGEKSLAASSSDQLSPQGSMPICFGARSATSAV
jgi:hypothetical protein